MKTKIWMLPLVMLAAGIIYMVCYNLWFPTGYADNLLLVFFPAFLLIILAGVVLRQCCSRGEAFWGALLLAGYNCAVYGLQIYLSRHLFEFGIRWLPYTGPMSLPIDIFKIPLNCFLYDILPETIGVQLTLPLGWIVCFIPLAYVLICRRTAEKVVKK